MGRKKINKNKPVAKASSSTVTTTKKKSPEELRKLPMKETNLFHSIVKCYETKQYKKGIKTSDSILLKFPEHGETLAMKGLILNCLDKKDEAYDNVKRGLKYDMKSHVCWHVYGLLYRSDRNYDQAIKCYMNALRIEPNNSQILNDLSLLQIQTRDLKKFAETRQKLLNLKSDTKAYWIGYALSQHLIGDNEKAVEVINSYIDTIKFDKKVTYEDSEMYLYLNELIEELGDNEKTLEHLEKIKPSVKDVLSYREKKGRLLLLTGKWKEAQITYKRLLSIFPENYGYHCGLQAAILETSAFIDVKGVDLPCNSSEYTLSPEDSKKLKEVYIELQVEKPRCAAHVRIPLDFLATDGNEFKDAAALYMQKRIKKGVVSLFSDLTPLIKRDLRKRVVVKEMVLTYIKNLANAEKFSPEDESEEAPTSILYCHFFISQMFDLEKEYGQAIKHIDIAIQHTPTLIDLYMRKAKFLKHAGDIQGAADVIDEGRKLDLADRYINTKTMKYLMRAGRIEEGNTTIALFTRADVNDWARDLFEMQNVHYEMACGNAHLKKFQYGRALKKFHAVEKHFMDFIEEQFDFHNYCLRKMTLRSYVKLLRLVDRVRGHENFTKACIGAVKTYILLNDHPEKDTTSEKYIPIEDMSASERKKAKQLARKKANEEEEEEAADTLKEDKDKKKIKIYKPDLDPQGAKLAACKTPLDEGLRFVKLLENHCAPSVEACIVSYELYMRRLKYLPALQCLNKASTIANDGSNEAADIHLKLVEFFKTVESLSEAFNPAVAQVITEQQTSILGEGISLNSFAKSFFAKSVASKKVYLRTQAACALFISDPSCKIEAVSALASVSTSSDIDITIYTLGELMRALGDRFCDKEAEEKIRLLGAELFPMANMFSNSI